MDAKTKSPQEGGLTRQGGCLYAEVADRRTGSLALLTGLSTYPYASACLVGETTRRQDLNPHRGSQPVGARRIVGKRKWQPEQSGEK
jgi:hypothetical protein